MTSQIFANIYLNELDRFIRHTVKPLGYIRYGDDFVLFLSDKAQAEAAQRVAIGWLREVLKLKIHDKNNVVVKATHGLQFLGHIIYPDSPLSADAFMVQKIKQNIGPKNMSSYAAMDMSRKYAKQLPWLLLNRQRGGF